MLQYYFLFSLFYIQFQTQSERHHRSRYARTSQLHGNSSGTDKNGSTAAVKRRARSEGPINRRPRWKATSFREEIPPATPINRYHSQVCHYILYKLPLSLKCNFSFNVNIFISIKSIIS